MKKLTRYKHHLGDYSCTDEDVAELEAEYAQMLEALENLVLQIEDHNYGIKSPAQYETIAFVAARAAIAKAKGEQP